MLAERTTQPRERNYRRAIDRIKTVYPYLQPRGEIPVYFASSGPKSARIAAEHGDHLITIASVPEVNQM